MWDGAYNDKYTNKFEKTKIMGNLFLNYFGHLEFSLFLDIFIIVGFLTVKGELSPRGYNQHEVESMGLTGGSKFK